VQTKPTLNQWIAAFRPWSFPASAMPALATIAFVYFRSRSGAELSDVNWTGGWIALVGAVIIHAGGNLFSDYFDYRHNVDRGETFGSSRLLVDGVFTPRTIYIYACSFMLFGIATGIYLSFQAGWQLVPIGLAGIAGAYFYYKLKYVALGDALIFVIYGLLIALGTSVVLTGTCDAGVLLQSAPIGFLVVNILHANNTRDILHDRKANIRTQAMLIGVKWSKFQYIALAVASYLVIIALVVAQILPPLCLSTLLTAPIAIRNIRTMMTAEVGKPEKIKALDTASAQLVLMFSLLLVLSNLISVYLCQ
jgi:1,4-dihydroxy-2-naphthoate octaprenyltransferase